MTSIFGTLMTLMRQMPADQKEKEKCLICENQSYLRYQRAKNTVAKLSSPIDHGFLVNGFNGAEAEFFIESHGGRVFGGHFERYVFQFGGAETVQ